MHSLKKEKDFQRVFQSCKKAHQRHLSVYLRAQRQSESSGFNRVGFACKRSVPNAVCRNRMKRLMRVAYRALEPQLLVNFDIVFVAHNFKDWKTFSDKLFESEMRSVLKKIKFFKAV